MLKRLLLTDFRNYPQAEFFPDPRISLIHGDNGSGKTSLLEAIYTLSTGRSFRTAKLGKLVRDQADQLLLFAEVEREGEIHRLGMRRGRQGIEDLRLDGERPRSLSQLAHLLPTQVFHPESVNLIYGESSIRRAFLDWGLFHVEHDFQVYWQRFRQLLEQRNKLLKSPSLSERELAPWNQQLVEVSARIDRSRRSYLARVLEHFQKAHARVGTLKEVDIGYYPGWPENETFETALTRHLEQDRQRGFTSVGPHRGDLRLRNGGHLAKDVFSRGQCKTLAYALLLAQLYFLVEEIRRPCLLLVDDLSSELDREHRYALFDALRQLNQQMIVSQLEDDGLFAQEEAKRFHVEHGWIKTSE